MELGNGTILYVGGFELPDKDAAAHRVLNNAKLLRYLGYKVVFIDVDRSNKIFKGLAYKEIYGFHVWSVKFPNSALSWLKYLTSISFIKKVISNYYDVKAIICYNYPAFSLLSLIKFTKKNRIKVIADCTEWYEDNRIVKKIDTELRMQYLHKRVDGVICISRFLKKYYENYVKTVVIPPLVDLSEDKWKYEIEKFDANVTNLVYCGNPGKHKDKLNLIIDAINSIQKVKPIKFEIIGITKEQYLEYYPEHITIIDKMDDTIKFLGRISHEASLSYVKKADFQIFIREDKRVNNAGFPTKFVESMACGTPVLTTRTSDLEMYIVDGLNGFFIDNEGKLDIEGILKKIQQLSREQISIMKNFCASFDKFNYKNFAGELTQFLEEVLN